MLHFILYHCFFKKKKPIKPVELFVGMIHTIILKGYMNITILELFNFKFMQTNKTIWCKLAIRINDIKKMLLSNSEFLCINSLHRKEIAVSMFLIKTRYERNANYVIYLSSYSELIFIWHIDVQFSFKDLVIKMRGF